jgi:hypothetical protein
MLGAVPLKRIMLEAVMSLRVCKAHLCSDARAAIQQSSLRFEAPHENWLVKTVCGRQKQERARDSPGPKNDSVKFYSCRVL